MFAFEGAYAIAPTERFAIESVSTVHDKPLSVVFQAPPPAAPTITVPATVGSVATAVRRPAPLVGPRLVQTEPPIERARGLPRVHSNSCLIPRVISSKTSESITPKSP